MRPPNSSNHLSRRSVENPSISVSFMLSLSPLLQRSLLFHLTIISDTRAHYSYRCIHRLYVSSSSHSRFHGNISTKSNIFPSFIPKRFSHDHFSVPQYNVNDLGSVLYSSSPNSTLAYPSFASSENSKLKLNHSAPSSYPEDQSNTDTPTFNDERQSHCSQNDASFSSQTVQVKKSIPSFKKVRKPRTPNKLKQSSESTPRDKLNAISTTTRSRKTPSSKSKTLKRVKLTRTPYDLVNFYNSKFVSHMNEISKRDSSCPFIKDPPDSMDTCLTQAGIAHERNILHLIKDKGISVVSVDWKNAKPDPYKYTEKLLQIQVPVIHQAFLRDDLFQGTADFLFRSDIVRQLWPHLVETHNTIQESSAHQYNEILSYFPCEVKLANVQKNQFILQACVYADMLIKTINKLLPDANNSTMPSRRNMKIMFWLGNAPSPSVYHFHDVYYFYTSLRSKYRTFLNNFSLETCRDSMPPPDAPLNMLRPWSQCAQEYYKKNDSLLQIAGIKRSQVAKLNKANISTLTQFADAMLVDLDAVSIPKKTLHNLHRQAVLQMDTTRDRIFYDDPKYPAHYEILETSQDAGLRAIPAIGTFDIFFDMESFPLYEELEDDTKGLEYLFGVSFYRFDSLTYLQKKYKFHGLQSLDKATGGKTTEQNGVFGSWWAHSREEEEIAFTLFIDFLWDIFQSKSAEFRVFHYGNYEKAAMNRLAARAKSFEGNEAGRRWEILERNNVFCDIYKHVRQGMRIGESSYSIKYLERICGIFRSENSIGDGSCQDAKSSVAMYYDYLCRKDPAILDEIKKYNAQDCESTMRLTRWLVDLKVELGLHQPLPRCINDPIIDIGTDSEGSFGLLKDEKQKEPVQGLMPGACGSKEDDKIEDSRVIEEAQRLVKDLRALSLTAEYEPRKEMLKALSDMCHFHVKESMPSRSRFIGRIKESESENLLVDSECLYGVVLIDQETIQKKRSKTILATYRYDPHQNCKLIEGTRVAFAVKGNVSCWGLIERIEDGEIIVSTTSKDVPKLASLIGYSAVCPAALRKSIVQSARKIVSNEDDEDSLTMINYLQREKLELLSGRDADVFEDEEILMKKIFGMKNSTLVIQGPPGSGKTELCSEMIARLARDGKTIAISSNSHASIMNLLEKVKAKGIKGVGKIGTIPEGSDVSIQPLKDLKKVGPEREGKMCVVGATVYPLSTNDASGVFDYLFVDEAGQVCVSNFVAAIRSARNALLVGDQQQLGMPLQASHSGSSALSCLEYLIGRGKAIVEAERGIFLGTSYRMSPDLCGFISDSFYEGNLRSFSGSTVNEVLLKRKKLIKRGKGLVYVPREQFEASEAELGNVQFSMVEVEIVSQLMEELLESEYITSRGRGILEMEDVLVVSPYNMQVNALKKALGPKARVGTVDKFQGQQAPVVIVSLCGVEDEDDEHDKGLDEVDTRGIGFVLHPNRMNVALSRAECVAIVVGSESLAQAKASSYEDLKAMSIYTKVMEYK